MGASLAGTATTKHSCMWGGKGRKKKKRKKVSDGYVSEDSHRFFRWSCVAMVTGLREYRCLSIQMLKQILSRFPKCVSIDYNCDYSEQG